MSNTELRGYYAAYDVSPDEEVLYFELGFNRTGQTTSKTEVMSLDGSRISHYEVWESFEAAEISDDQLEAVEEWVLNNGLEGLETVDYMDVFCKDGCDMSDIPDHFTQDMIDFISMFQEIKIWA